jgi:predicted phage terminase large subunit-like protein
VSVLDLSRIDTTRLLQVLDRQDCEESLYAFLQSAWRFVDSAPFCPGWPLEAVCEHLEAVVDGEIRRLLINIPPRCGKSTITSICFPAWVWAQSHNSPTSGPGVQLLHASHAMSLAMRDSVKCRRLIEGPWYQRLWGSRFRLVGDQNTKGRFANDHKGERLITSVDSKLTGEGGSIIVIDDPNDANEVLSAAVIESTNEWWDGTMSTRLNDPNTGAFVVIQQRLGEEDLTGHILETDHGWTHLCLPMRYDQERAIYTVTTLGQTEDGEAIEWRDPRSVDGELLWPERFDDMAVSELERRLGPWKAAGQLQQLPRPRGGGIIKEAWWIKWEDRVDEHGRMLPAEFPPFEFILASLDTAYTEKQENDLSALTIWGVFAGDVVAKATKDERNVIVRTYDQSHPRVMLMDAWTERLELHDLVVKVAASCKKMKVDRLLIENKAAGISVAQELRRLFGTEAFGVQLVDPRSQDKVARLHSVEPLFADGMIYAPDRNWADKVIRQVTDFPRGKHDDLVDTVSQALRHLRDNGMLIRGPEWTAAISDSMAFTGKGPEPLYPA